MIILHKINIPGRKTPLNERYKEIKGNGNVLMQIIEEYKQNKCRQLAQYKKQTGIEK